MMLDSKKDFFDFFSSIKRLKLGQSPKQSASLSLNGCQLLKKINSAIEAIQESFERERVEPEKTLVFFLSKQAWDLMED